MLKLIIYLVETFHIVIYQLPNGKVIEMSVEQFLDLDDRDIQELNGLGQGYSVDVNSSKSFANNKPIVDVEIENEEDLTTIDKTVKFHDKYFHRDDI